jgi:hypothetical protein
MRGEDSIPRSPPTDSPRHGSCPACRPVRNTVARHPPNDCLSLEIRYHRQSSTPPPHVFALPEAQPPGPAAGLLHRSRAHRQLRDATTDASVRRCPEPAVPPSVPHSCVRREAAEQCSNSSMEQFDLRALRLAPGLSVDAGEKRRHFGRFWPEPVKARASQNTYWRGRGNDSIADSISPKRRRF